MDIVFGVSMAPSTVRMVLVEGENGDGATVDQDAFPVTTAAATGDAATSSAIYPPIESPAIARFG